ncbi:MAG TPA: dihydroorotase [Firmicutes bacterium]|nr:dihydroorotase [Bacillota bacterium]
MREIVLQGGTVVDPSQKLHGVYDVLIGEGKVTAVARRIPAEDRMILDVSGLTVVPGLIDVHTHLREPGYEEKETVPTGGRAAAAGGYTAIAAMPNTRPVTDSAAKIRQLKQLAAGTPVRVWPVGAATKGSLGEEAAEIAAMAESGACAVTDDGRGIQSAGMARQVLQLCAQSDLPLLEHCEDESIAGCGQLHGGRLAQKLKLPAIPVSSETVMLARDILLAGETQARLHLMHLSAAASVEILRLAKERGLPVTAEVTPHHLLLTENDVENLAALAKMKPPLRSAADRAALQSALAEGVIDIIATDHAPHTETEKNSSFADAPFGVVGLETAFPVLYTCLVEAGILTIDQLVDRMSCRPAAVFRLPGGTLKPGSPADVAVFDLRSRYKIDKTRFYSKGKNTPFHGLTVRGRPVLTLVGGRIVMRNGKVY